MSRKSPAHIMVENSGGEYNPPFFRTAYDGLQKQFSDLTAYEQPKDQDPENPVEARTLQSEAKACDINVIISQWSQSGVLSHTSKQDPTYGDFTNGDDLHTMLSRVAEAQSQFMELPAQLRSRFHNDPGRLLDFLADDANREEAVKLGLVNPPPEPSEGAPDKVKAVAPSKGDKPPKEAKKDPE